VLPYRSRYPKNPRAILEAISKIAERAHHVAEVANKRAELVAGKWDQPLGSVMKVSGDPPVYW